MCGKKRREHEAGELSIFGIWNAIEAATAACTRRSLSTINSQPSSSFFIGTLLSPDALVSEPVLKFLTKENPKNT